VPRRLPTLVSRVAVRSLRAVGRALPSGVMRQLDDRVFYAVFNLTRVTNDAYGWRPDVDDGPAAKPSLEPKDAPIW
jgi:hypothetical protein